jgi:hypothetical protein
MKKIYVSLFFILFGASFAYGQTTITNLTFETPGGYSTSIPEFSYGLYTFFTRADEDISYLYQVYDIQGSYFFVAEDLDGLGDSETQTLTINDIDISSYTALQLKVFIAEDDHSNYQNWDAEDFLHIDYDIDNTGSFSQLLWVESENLSNNSEPRIDTDFDGIGDGSPITDTFTQYSADITGTGSLLDIQLTFQFDSPNEDVAVDNIEIIGIFVPDPQPTNHVLGFTAAANDSWQIDFAWNDNDGTQDASGF